MNLHRNIVTKIINSSGVLLLLFASVLTANAADRVTQEQAAHSELSFSTIQAQETTMSFQSHGIIEPRRKLSLTSMISGRVIDISPVWFVGGVVKKGEALLKVDDTDYKHAVALAEQAVAQAKLDLEVELAKAETEQFLDNKSTRKGRRLGLREPYIAFSKAQLVAAQAQLKKAQRDLADTLIRAPFDVLITEKFVELSAIVSAGDKLAELIDVSTAQLRFAVDSSIVKYLNQTELSTLPVTVEVDVVDQPLTARLVRSEGQFDAQSRRLFFVAELQSSQLPALLKSIPFGAYASIHIANIPVTHGMWLSRQSLRGNRVAIVNADNKIEFVPVKVVSRFEDQFLIETDTLLGSNIVNSSVAFLKEGTSIDKGAFAAQQKGSGL